MGRPLKNDKDKRSKSLNIRFLDDEILVIKENQQKTNLTISDYIRKVVLDKKIKPATPKIDLDSYRLLSKISVNLNQIAKVVNIKGNTPVILSSETQFIINELYKKLFELKES